MPIMDGMTFIEFVRKEETGKEVPIMIYSTELDKSLKEEAKKLGVKILGLAASGPFTARNGMLFLEPKWQRFFSSNRHQLDINFPSSTSWLPNAATAALCPPTNRRSLHSYRHYRCSPSRRRRRPRDYRLLSRRGGPRFSAKELGPARHQKRRGRRRGHPRHPD